MASLHRLPSYKVQQCAIHQAVLAAAASSVDKSGTFSKTAVLETAGYEHFAGSIRWDCITRWLAQEFDNPLVPLRGSFFREGLAVGNLKVKHLAEPNSARAAGFVLERYLDDC